MPALKEMSALRRALHLIWEILCPYEIVTNSEQRARQIAGSVYMEKTGEEKNTSLMRERVQERKRRTHSEHVELVIARIFSKQREYAKQRWFRFLGLEDVSEDRS